MDSFIFLAKFCPSLPIIWKLFWLVVWPVWILWWWMAEGAFRCSLYLLPKSWRFPLCTHHHSLGPHTGTNRWYHFGWPLGLCPWGRPEDFWWLCHLWSIGQGHYPQGKNSYGSWRHYPPFGILSQKHLFLFPRPVLWTGWGCCHGFPS